MSIHSVRLFIGYDTRQPIAATIAMHSVYRRSSVPVNMSPLVLETLPLTRKGLTQFTYARYLVPALSGFTGVSIFMDADMLCLGDIAELFAYPLAYPEVDVFVVPHKKKFERPSVMVFNNARCTVLTAEYVQDATHPLFPLEWATSVGELPCEWNHLVGYDTPNPSAKIVHFTMGCPCWPETIDCEFSEAWKAEAKHAMSTVSFQALMGRSVHVQHMKKVGV